MRYHLQGRATREPQDGSDRRRVVAGRHIVEAMGDSGVWQPDAEAEVEQPHVESRLGQELQQVGFDRVQ